MILFCDECGAKNSLASDEIDKTPGYILCKQCGDIIKVPTHKVLKFRLEIRYQDNIIEMNNEKPVISLGRKPQNDVVVEDKRVSRLHAVIVYLAEKIMLIDMSKNGTFVQINGNEWINVKKGQYQLSGSGVISLWQRAEPDSSDAIHFRVLEGNELNTLM